LYKGLFSNILINSSSADDEELANSYGIGIIKGKVDIEKGGMGKKHGKMILSSSKQRFGGSMIQSSGTRNGSLNRKD
jgi:hypothetical protein